MKIVVVWFVFLATEIFAIDFLDPRVFSVSFYSANNPQVPSSRATDHWLSVGIEIGLQGCGSFHSRQYIGRYPDLNIFGHDYKAAVAHYLSTGYNEGRLGYLDGGAYGRWTISNKNNSGLFVSTSTRTAGAIDSVVWNNKEFINAYDHGRELQTAYTFGRGECLNPTQAGRSADGISMTSTSILAYVESHDNVLSSINWPAYWLAPGELENPALSYYGNCTVGLSSKDVSDYQTIYRVKVNFPVIEFDFNVSIAETHTLMKIEAPTGYMTGDFELFVGIHPNGTMFQVNLTIPGLVTRNYVPVVCTTADLKYAMGIFPLEYPPTTNRLMFATWRFPSDDPASATNKWNLVWNTSAPVLQGQILHFRSRICVGDYSTVLDCMSQFMGVSISRLNPLPLSGSILFPLFPLIIFSLLSLLQ